MTGTIRTFSPEHQELVHRRIREIATHIAASAGAEAEVEIPMSTDYPVTVNDPELTEEVVPSLRKVAGDENVIVTDLITGAEDFSYFANEVPGFFFFLAGSPSTCPWKKPPPITPRTSSSTRAVSSSGSRACWPWPWTTCGPTHP